MPIPKGLLTLIRQLRRIYIQDHNTRSPSKNPDTTQPYSITTSRSSISAPSKARILFSRQSPLANDRGAYYLACAQTFSALIAAIKDTASLRREGCGTAIVPIVLYFLFMYLFFLVSVYGRAIV